MTPTPGNYNQGLNISHEIVPEYYLLKAYPNPFNNLIRLQYFLEKNEYVTIRVLDILGREPVVLHSGRERIGKHNINWTGKNHQGKTLPSGLWLIQTQKRR